MIKNLVKHGNSVALILDRSILELVRIDPADPVEITTDGARLIIAPATGVDPKKRFKAAVSHVNKKHARTLKRLAE